MKTLDTHMCECLLCAEVLRKGNEVLDRLRSEFMLSSDMFTGNFAKLWQIFNDLDLSGEKINLATVSAYYQGDEEFIDDLWISGGLVQDIDSLARTIYKKYLLKEKTKIQEILNEKINKNEPTFEAYNELVKLNELLDDNIIKQEYSSVALVNKLFEQLESDEEEQIYDIGFNFKCYPGDLVIIGARPGVGKTSIGISILNNLKEPSLFYALEMKDTNVTKKLIACMSNLELYRMAKPYYNEAVAEIMTKAQLEMSNRQIEFNFNRYITVETIIADVEKYRREGKNIKHIFIDYLGLMVKDSMINRTVELDRITRELKLYALKQDITIFAMCQLSRLSTQRTDKRPMLSDLRESGGIEQNADSVLFVHREEIYNPTPENAQGGELIISKNRHGEGGSRKMHFNPKTTKFTLI